MTDKNQNKDIGTVLNENMAQEEGKNTNNEVEKEIKEGMVKGKEERNKEDKTEEKKKEKEETGKESEKAEEDGDARYIRLMADFQNYKRRVEKEKKDLYAYANEKIVNELLAVMDNFERALEQESGDGFKEGMEMIFKQLGDVLEKSGLSEIPSLGEVFDPNVHNAVMTEETEEYESGKVSGVMQKGYTLNGKVIRPAMVKVAN